MICQHCGQQHKPNIKFCPQTGKNLEVLSEAPTEQIFCQECGEKNLVGNAFCLECGAALQQTSMASSATDAVEYSSNNSATTILSEEEIVINNSQNVQRTPQLHSQTHFEKADAPSGKAKFKVKPFMFIMSLVPVAIMLFIASIFALGVKEEPYILEDFFGSEVETLLDKNEIEEELFYDFDSVTKYETEDFPLIPALIGLMHNNGYEFSGSETEDGDSVTEVRMVKFLFFLIVAPLIALFIGVLIFGLIGRFAKWTVQEGVIVVTLVYTIFMAVIGVLSQYKLYVSMNEYGSKYELEINGSTPVVSLIVTGFVLSLVMSMLVLYPLLKRNTIPNTSSTVVGTIRVIYYAAFATLAVFIANILYALTTSHGPLEDLLEDMLYSSGGGIFDLLLTSVAAITSWGTSLGGTYHAFYSSYGDIENYNVSQEILTSKVILMAMAAIVLIAIGYLIAKKGPVTMQQMIIFAAVFTVIQLVFVNLTAIEISEVMDEDKNILSVNFEFLPILIGAFVLSFVGIFVGNLIRNKKEQ